ncbi:MAG: lysine--tRNA ligase [Christensenellaceae bacterium]|jgi:lysyl-tRNA synthetase class 2|nr:lysine--tRNA ligase [Christensenellaceae bacterium]
MDETQCGTTNHEINITSEIESRREKLKSLKEAGLDPFKEVRYEASAYAQSILEDNESYINKPVKLAGRIISKRIMGRASFAHIDDGTSRIQIYVKSDVIGEELYNSFKRYDVGDIVGIEGEVFVTHKGETSIKVSAIKLLAKSLLPLPEKFHGLKDTELRYRQRYLDLIVNPEVKETFITRSRIISAIRSFLNEQGYLEVETPILNTILGGANARPFTTHHNTLDIDMFLRIAPELYLKRLIVGGFLKVYEMGRLFRNEGMSVKHNPEFTTMECYSAYSDYNDMMDLVENLFKFCADRVLGTRKFSYQGVELNIDGKWRRVAMSDLVKEETGLDFYALTSSELRDGAIKLGLDIKETFTDGEVLYEIFDRIIEERLIQPTFVLDYPVEVSPLAKRKNSDPRLTERFEFFIMGREMGNAFSELNDPIDQRIRFEAQALARAAGDDEAQMMDEDFVTALEYGMPPTGGLGIGIDRMIMLFTDAQSIRDVLLFPTMKPRLT